MARDERSRQDMVLGVFSSRDHAEEAISDLKERGYEADNISVVMKDDEGPDAGKGAVSGGVTGAIIGGVVGLAAGLTGFLVGGPIAAAAGMAGAIAATAGGAAAGGLAGVLVGLGVSQVDARTYEEHVKSGGIFVAAPVNEENPREAEEIMESHGAEQVKVMPLYLREKEQKKKIKIEA